MVVNIPYMERMGMGLSIGLIYWIILPNILGIVTIQERGIPMNQPV